MAEPKKNTGKEIDRFDDVFHSHDDDRDEDADDYVDFDNAYNKFHMQNDDDDEQLLLNLPPEDDKEADNDDKKKTTNPPVISLVEEQEEEEQQHPVSKSVEPKTPTTTRKRPSITPSTSESSITVLPAATTTTKKLKVTEPTDVKTDADLPRFLSRTQDIFQEAMKSHLTGKQRAATSHSINIEQLRKIALIKFYIAVNKLDLSLWETHLQSGTGKIEALQSSTNEPQQQAAARTTTTVAKPVKLLRWPSDLKEKMIASGFLPADHNKRIDGDTCLEYVNKQIRFYQNKNTKYQNELKEEKQRLANSFTVAMEETMDTFIEQHGTSFHRIPIDGQISTIQFKYQDRLMELEFHEQSPREYQLDVFQTISKLKYAKENAKMNVAVLKQRLVYNHLPSSFESLHIPEPNTLQAIQDDTIRQHLNERYQKVLQRTKSDMLHVYIAAEQAKADQCIQEFNRDYTEMKENLRIGPTHKKLTSTMLQLLQKRLTLINKHIMQLYNLKIDFFVKAPTGKN